MEFAGDVYQYWRPRMLNYLFKPNEKQVLTDQLEKAKSYEQWHDIALKLDHSQGNDIWRMDPASSDYDYKLIAFLVFKLEQLRRKNNITDLMEVLRSGLIRNMGSIASSELYTSAYSGTKVLIEDYINSVNNVLEYLGGMEPENDELLTFFSNARQSYGRTALILHGGSMFGFCHLGVVKNLLSYQLLPSVICGASVGSIVAAFVCSLPPDEIIDAIEKIGDSILPYADLSTGGQLGNTSEHIHKSLFSKEVLMLFEFLTEHLEMLTFEEAYIRSGLVLNILVLQNGSNSGTFFNYLTTPKVVIRSAVLASIGSNILPGHYHVKLLFKDYEGRIRTDPQSDNLFLPANHKTLVPMRDSPYTRLAELFNVNNYIVSVSRPYFAPILLSEFKYRGQPKLWHRACALARISFQYRVGQLADWGIISPQLISFFTDETIPGGFQVNIVPEPDSLIRDFLMTFDSANIAQKVKHWINLGERSVWPQMSIIWARTKTEYVLEQLNQKVP